MGEKGSKRTGEAKASAGELVTALQPLGDVTSKGMFGGYGVFIDGQMFAIVDSAGDWYLKADDSTAPRFEAAGSAKHGRMPYWSVPADVAGDDALLLEWAGEAAAVARG